MEILLRDRSDLKHIDRRQSSVPRLAHVRAPPPRRTDELSVSTAWFLPRLAAAGANLNRTSVFLARYDSCFVVIGALSAYPKEHVA